MARVVDDAYPPHEYPHLDLTKAIISAAIEVHRHLGPGFLEKIYEQALVQELQSRGHSVQQQLTFDVAYKGNSVGEHRVDLLVDDLVVLELNSVDELAAKHKAQLRSTLKAAKKRIGLLINFNQSILTDGVKRVIN